MQSSWLGSGGGLDCCINNSGFKWGKPRAKREKSVLAGIVGELRSHCICNASSWLVCEVIHWIFRNALILHKVLCIGLILCLYQLIYCCSSRASMVALAGKESSCNAGDQGSIPGLGRSPGEGNGYSLQYSDLENSMNCIVHGVAKSQTWLSDFHFTSSL